MKATTDWAAYFKAHTTKDNVTGCLTWVLSRSRLGYGVCRAKAVPETLAHRVAFIKFIGPIPSGLSVLHTCDNLACVNPKHLALGTHADNMRDMAVKQRGTSQFTPEQVRAIRQSFPAKTQAALGRVYGVSQSTISLIISRKRYNHVT